MRRLVLPLVFLVSACRLGAWQDASKADSAVAYRTFLAQHPADENAEAARARLTDLEFKEACRVHTVLAYKRFLEEFPTADEARAAWARLEALRFNAAQAQHTAIAWRAFLREHPTGANRAEAERLLSLQELQDIAQATDPAELARFVDAHPDDPRAPDVAARLEERRWHDTEGAGALFTYLREFPAGAHRDEARVRLLDLQLEGFLVSGLVDQARALVKRSPLVAQVKEVAARLARAEARARVHTSKTEAVQRALAAWHLRSIDDLVKALSSPDPADRADAARELGEWASVASLDPLLEALRSSRSPLVRQRAFDSLARVLRALPRDVAAYEVAARIEARRDQAADAQLQLEQAVLLDVSGELGRAAAEYQKAWDPANPDPVVLRRWVGIRLERRQGYSAAVAARQLSLWAQGLAERAGPPTPNGALAASREACVALEASQAALAGLTAAEALAPEFPEDVAAFAARAREIERGVEAHLRDAELVLLGQDARARRCADRPLEARLEAAEAARLEAIAALRRQPPKELELVLEEVRLRDPSARVREAAGASGR